MAVQEAQATPTLRDQAVERVKSSRISVRICWSTPLSTRSCGRSGLRPGPASRGRRSWWPDGASAWWWTHGTPTGVARSPTPRSTLRSSDWRTG